MIQFDNVYKSYAGGLIGPVQKALKGLSFTLENGKTMGLVGANGAGKSTCIRLMMDFIRADDGSISILGSPPSNRRLRKRIGYLPEIPSFPPNLNILDMLRFTGKACNLSETTIRVRAEHWLKKLHLWKARRRPLRNYSKGMQQRASFCLALMNDADLFILDEPMSGLDPVGRAEILCLIHELKKSGKTILFCSHILEDIDRVADTILVLHKGEKLFSGSPETLCKTRQARDLPDAFLKLIGESDGCDQVH